MTDEDKKLIVEWCGGHWMTWTNHPEYSIKWFLPPDPDDKKIYKEDIEFNGNLDLNFYFTYAVPELRSIYQEFIFIDFSFDWAIKTCLVDIRVGKKPYSGEAMNDPAEAFGQALLKLARG